MNTITKYIRYSAIVPIVGLILAAMSFFVLGGAQLIILIFRTIGEVLGLIPASHADVAAPFAVEIVEYVHQFLIGTVFFITGLGFYQLFIASIDVPAWLKVDNTEQLETSLVGVTVVVMAVHFMIEVFNGGSDELLSLGLSSAAVIAALGLFVGLRAWADQLAHSRHNSDSHDTP